MIDLADIAQEAALKVGPDLLAAFADPGEVQYKRNFHDPVTVHDKRAEAAIRSVLFERAPESLILGEEEGRLIDSAGKQHAIGEDGSRVTWLVDPIDGTSNFASGLEWWCVSIGAVVGDDVVAGVIYQPTTNRLYRADETGAYLNGEPIHASQAPAAQTLVASDFPSDRNSHLPGAPELLATLVAGSRSVRRLGSTALHLALVAEGVLGGTLGLATNPWDIGAGVALVRAAGGRYVGFDKNFKASETGAHYLPSYAAAGNESMMDLLMDAASHVKGAQHA